MYSKEAKEYVIKDAVRAFLHIKDEKYHEMDDFEIYLNRLTNLCVGTAFAQSDFHHITNKNYEKSHYMIYPDDYEYVMYDLIEKNGLSDRFFEQCNLRKIPKFNDLAGNLFFATVVVLFLYFHVHVLLSGDGSLESFCKSLCSPENMSKHYCFVFNNTKKDFMIKQNLVYFERAEAL